MFDGCFLALHNRAVINPSDYIWNKTPLGALVWVTEIVSEHPEEQVEVSWYEMAMEAGLTIASLQRQQTQRVCVNRDRSGSEASGYRRETLCQGFQVQPSHIISACF